MTVGSIHHYDVSLLKLFSIMIKLMDRTPLSRLELLQAQSVQSSPSKYNVKISSNQRLPPNFFSMQNNQKKIMSVKKQPQTLVSSGRIQPQTQHQDRASSLYRRLVETPRREMSTALERKDNEQDLIMGVISTAREMKKMIRKHSIEIKKSRNVRRDDFGVQLPPLILKRGTTTAF